ncbi:phosphotransferase enzyme family protein [Actinomadura rupiterrae]|uniref:phosphotransferase enzyme family protein n=1 Tax=Actinomadura rupiterrae TaxID=559627 RepID=UPI0020A4C97A|nr:phosphotransferase [Actinomadura rupiterrae]MCP2340973.1 Ser/Thr protein kinase RdoA (MazF antagonist) [Actinomadura rupiterrae]
MPTSSRVHDDEPLPPRLPRRWEIEAGAVLEPLNGGRERRWRVNAAGASYLLREHRVPDRKAIRLRHEAMKALDDAGLPVLAPVAARNGKTLVVAGGLGYELFPWASGRRRDGLELTFVQCERLGALLGQLHVELDRATGPVQQSMLLLPTSRASAAIAAVDAALEETPDDGTDFSALTVRRLRERRELLSEFADHQPPEIDTSVVGRLHGAFHQEHLRYGRSGEVSAVLGWDAMTLGPLAGEVVGAAARLFACGDDRGFDLDRVQAFLHGHRTVVDLDAGQIQSAVHRAWWERLCDVASMRQRYLGDDTAESDGDGASTALVAWWSANLERTLDAFAVPYTAVADDNPAYG